MWDKSNYFPLYIGRRSTSEILSSDNLPLNHQMEPMKEIFIINVGKHKNPCDYSN